MTPYDIIKRPIVSEKTTLQKEAANQVTFEVDRGANRVDIKRAVETAFQVKVMNVQTMQVTGKVKRRGRILGKRRSWKKAMVRLMPGERIEFFDGV
jgi:large subunit ribosomal protein L23